MPPCLNQSSIKSVLVELSQAQASFLADESAYPAFVAGFGSGKTYAASHKLLRYAMRHPGIKQAYYAPSYGQIRDVFYESITECCESVGFDAVIKLTDKEVTIKRGSAVYGEIICRSMDNPASIVGYKVARSHVDELDTLPMKKARKTWQKIIARHRQEIRGLTNRGSVSTTPEGFRFVYNHWDKDPGKGYTLHRSSTHDNAANLPDDYITNMLEIYPPELVDAYIRGLFVNLTSGSVYTGFDRKLNGSDAVWDGKEPLHIGADFNVGKMAAVVHVIRDKLPIAVDEIVNAYDTPDLIRVIKERYKGASIIMYPDASGRSRDTGAPLTDVQLLEQAGLRVDAGAANPAIKDRINCMNAMLHNAKGERRYKINAERCPTYVLCFEQQAYDDNGLPDKASGLDHHPDAGGYFISRKYPIERPGKLNMRF